MFVFLVFVAESTFALYAQKAPIALFCNNLAAERRRNALFNGAKLAIILLITKCFSFFIHNFYQSLRRTTPHAYATLSAGAPKEIKK